LRCATEKERKEKEEGREPNPSIALVSWPRGNKKEKKKRKGGRGKGRVLLPILSTTTEEKKKREEEEEVSLIPSISLLCPSDGVNGEGRRGRRKRKEEGKKKGWFIVSL